MSKRQSSPSYVTVKPKNASEDCKKPRRTENQALRHKRDTGKLSAEDYKVYCLMLIAKNPTIPAYYDVLPRKKRPAVAITDADLPFWIGQLIGRTPPDVRSIMVYIDEVLAADS